MFTSNNINRHFKTLHYDVYIKYQRVTRTNSVSVMRFTPTKYLIKYVHFEHELVDITPTILITRTWGNENVIDQRNLSFGYGR